MSSSMDSRPGYWFTSSLFEVEPGEDEETNPRMYGRQLANWLRSKFELLGYEVEEVIPEDWGWCVMCQRDPYMLFIGCVNRIDYEVDEEDDTPPLKQNLLWHAVPFAEIPFFKRLFRKINTQPGLDKLDCDLCNVLDKESGIEVLAEKVSDAPHAT